MIMNSRNIIVTILLMLVSIAMSAQEKFGNAVSFDRTVHDFGTVQLNSGALACTFTFKNIDSKPMAIYNIVTSCGCTTIDYPREPIMPGKSATIKVEYTNDEGPYPFDKSVTVQMSNYSKPIILRIRGVCVDKNKSLKDIYPESYGAFGLMKREFSLGTVDQGKSKSDEAYVANISGSSARISFTDVTPGLEISVSPNPIPANSTAKMSFRVTCGDDMWGKTQFSATPTVNGKPQTGKLPVSINCFVKEDFDGLTDEQIRASSLPMFTSSSYNFGLADAGDIIEGKFRLRNQGKSPLVIHRIQADSKDVTFTDIPRLGPNETYEFGFRFDTKNRKPGEEVLVIVTLTTNSPKRPMVNLFIQGYIK